MEVGAIHTSDIYDALHMPRPYKKAWPRKRSQAYIREKAAKHVAPHLGQILDGFYSHIDAFQSALDDCKQEALTRPVRNSSAAAERSINNHSRCTQKW